LVLYIGAKLEKALTRSQDLFYYSFAVNYNNHTENKPHKASASLEEELLALSYKHDNEITLAIDDILKLFKQYAMECVPEERLPASKRHSSSLSDLITVGWDECREQMKENINNDNRVRRTVRVAEPV